MEKPVLPGSSGKFEKLCSLKFHDTAEDNSNIYELDQRRFVNAKEKEYILSENVLKDYLCKLKTRKIYVCDTCLQTVRNLMLHPNKRLKKDTDESPSTVSQVVCGEEDALDEAVSVVLNAIEGGSITKKQLSSLLVTIGKRFFNKFRDNKQHLHAARFEEMKNKSYLDIWKLEPNEEWKELLENVCGNRETVDACTSRRLVKCTDLVRENIDVRYISNVALSEALLLLQFSHSKYAVDLFCKTNAAGSFSTVRRTMDLLGSRKFSLPLNDVLLAFDNNQVIQRTWMFKYGGKQVVSTVTTMVCYEEMNKVKDHQFSMTIPTALFPTESNRSILLSRFKEFTTTSSNVTRNYRKSFIEARLKKLAMDCQISNGIVHDEISAETTDVVDMKNMTADDVFNYSRVASCGRSSRVMDLECLLENPNSYLAVGHILDEILKYLHESPKERKFIPVYMDGAPYSICMKLVRERYTCKECNVDVDAVSKLTHVNEKHKGSPEPSWTRKYKEIVIRPGSGHIEMNCVRTIISTFWIPFIKPIASLLGYNSESQLEYCRKAYDHHKSYNLLMVVYAAMSDELLYPYLKTTLLQGNKPNYEDYCTWAAKMEQDNLLYKLASRFCFTTLHSLQLFRSGLRNCNDEVALHARHKLTSLLYGCNNIKYQEILCYDTLYILSLQQDARRAIINESSRRQDGDVGEGYDFLLENRNKLYKSFLPSDSAPTFDQWVQVTKNAGDLEEIREIAGERLNLNLRTSAQRPKKFHQEICGARRLIRKHGLLMRTKHDLTAINDENTKLEASFTSYLMLCENNRQEYYEQYVKGGKIHLPLINTGVDIGIDSEKGKEDDIRDAVQRKLNMLREPFYSVYKKSYKKNMAKPDLIEFHRAIATQLQHQHDADYEGMLSEAFKGYMSLHS